MKKITNVKQKLADRERIEMMKKEIVFMFSGQGSQFPQMGLKLYQNSSVFRQWMDRMDGYIKEKEGYSVLEQIYFSESGKKKALSLISYSHLAIFMVQFALSQVFLYEGIRPNMVLGVSLGEYVAACVAQVFDYQTALDLILNQIHILHKTCHHGNMITVLDSKKLYQMKDYLRENTYFIAENYEGHFTVSAQEEKATKAIQGMKSDRISFVKLPVEYAFHSPEIDGMKESYFQELSKITYQRPSIKIGSSASGDYISNPCAEHFWKVLREPIYFAELFKSIYRDDCMYLDLGPFGTLKNLAKHMIPDKIDENFGSILFPGSHQYEKMKLLLKNAKEIMVMEEGFVKQKAYLFPGQGSQCVGMGKELFEKYPQITKTADKVLGYSIRELCLEDSKKQLGITEFTQPALYTVNCLEYLESLDNNGEKPDFVAGHSLGEYAALFAAGVFDFETGLKIVKKRAELMNQEKGGAMAAVIGLTEEEIQEVLEENHLEQIYIANLNSPKQIVISGPKSDIGGLEELFKQNTKCRYILLNVSGAFHSPYMESAAKEFKDYISKFKFESPDIPIISNCTARPYHQRDIIDHMYMQMIKPVKWTETIRYLAGKDVADFEQIGPGNTTTNLVKQILKETEPLEVEEEEVLKNDCVEEEKKETKEIFIEIEQPAAKKLPKANDLPEINNAKNQFCNKYGLKYPFVGGSMDHGISGKQLVSEMAKAGCLAFLSSTGLTFDQIHEEILETREMLTSKQFFGVNISYNPGNWIREDRMANLLIELDVPVVEASSYLTLTKELVKYKVSGLFKDENGEISSSHRVIAKVTRPDIAELFLLPIPNDLLKKLRDAGEITEEQFHMGAEISVADDICVVGDQAGPTDNSNLLSCFPVIKQWKEENQKTNPWLSRCNLGVAGGIGTKDAVKAVFTLGADFILAGSVLLCTPESEISDSCKEVLKGLQVHDTQLLSSPDLFGLVTRQRVVRKGLFFPARANHLYELYRSNRGVGDLSVNEKRKLETKYFNYKIEDILRDFNNQTNCDDRESSGQNEKSEMAILFKWYMEKAILSAKGGNQEERMNYCIKCSSALGALNQQLKGTALEDWKKRNVAKIVEFLMSDLEVKEG